jgi:hypothetical protein
MLAMPSSLRMQFEEHLRDKSIEYSMHGLYKKCLRFYLDFSNKKYMHYRMLNTKGNIHTRKKCLIALRREKRFGPYSIGWIYF